ncbi:MAG: hypothetical protein IBJ11_07250 [Phycisphaerales bacterium]|nr:hypothetical protein [Phycisphaerales bacterium]
MTIRTRFILVPSLALLTLAAPGVFAEPAGDAPLGGPGVKDRNTPGRPSFGEPGKLDKQAGRGELVPHPLFMRAMMALNGPDAPANVKANEEQVATIRAIEQEFRDAQRAYMEQHKDEIAKLRQAAGMPERGRGGEGGPAGPGERRRPGGRGPGGGNPDGNPPPPPPGAGDDGAPPPPPGGPGGRGGRGQRGERPPATPEQEAARAKLREFMEAGPKPQAYHDRMWKELSAPQQEFVKARIESLRSEMGPGRGPGGPGGPGNLGNPGAPGAGGPGQRGDMQQFMNPDGTPNIERIKERLGSMPAERRERILERLRQRFPGIDKQLGLPAPAPKPAPNMNDVPVPPPADPMDGGN